MKSRNNESNFAINPFNIMKEVEIAYNLKPGEIIKHARGRTVDRIRKISIWTVRHMTHLNLEEIADYFDRDVKTITNALRYVHKKEIEEALLLKKRVYGVYGRRETDLNNLMGEEYVYKRRI